MSHWPAMISEHAKIKALGLDFSYPDVGDLLPITILCGISLLLNAMWLLAVWEYVRLKGQTRSKKLTGVHKHA